MQCTSFEEALLCLSKNENKKMKKHNYIQWGVFALLVFSDQLSKGWIAQQSPDLYIQVIENFFNIIVAHNYGVAFSMFADWGHAWRTRLLIIATICIALIILWMWWQGREKNTLESWLFILILAGACGNIWDRIQLGYVIDFIQWYVVIDGEGWYWPAFNIADSCISVAVVLLIIDSFRPKKSDD